MLSKKVLTVSIQVFGLRIFKLDFCCRSWYNYMYLREIMQGIYYLELDNKFYIGRATDIEFRVNRHHQLLLRKAHPNPKIVKAWEDGGRVLNSGVVEICDENLSVREMFWINEFDAINSGLNMSKTTYFSKGCVTLVAPGGEIVPVGSAADICREFELDPGAVSKVIHGKLEMHKGWTLYRPKVAIV